MMNDFRKNDPVHVLDAEGKTRIERGFILQVNEGASEAIRYMVRTENGEMKLLGADRLEPYEAPPALQLEKEKEEPVGAEPDNPLVALMIAQLKQQQEAEKAKKQAAASGQIDFDSNQAFEKRFLEETKKLLEEKDFIISIGFSKTDSGITTRVLRNGPIGLTFATLMNTLESLKDGVMEGNSIEEKMELLEVVLSMRQNEEDDE